MSQSATVHDDMSRHEAWRMLRSRLRADLESRPPAPPPAPRDERVVWFDYAKGICILLVVMMHSTLGVGEAMGGEGFMHTIVAFAKPFRMPDFFLLAGLFLFRAIGRDWRTYLDRKLVHFAYFYVLWLLILMGVKEAPLLLSDPQAWFAVFAAAFVTPNPNLWFLYDLALFFVATKLAHAVCIPNWALWLGAALLQTFPPHTGWEALDDYGARYYVFFLTGYMLAPKVFQLAAWARDNAGPALIGLSGWLVFNAMIAFAPAGLPGIDTFAEVPVVRIVAGLIGAAAVVTVAALLSRLDVARFIRYAGRNSIVLYVSFVLPMAATRILLVKSGLITDVGIVSLIVTAVAAAVPLLLHRLVRGTRLRFLYERPEALKLEPRGPLIADPSPSARLARPRRVHPPMPVPTARRG